jgi:hypothetical protein
MHIIMFIAKIFCLKNNFKPNFLKNSHSYGKFKKKKLIFLNLKKIIILFI